MNLAISLRSEFLKTKRTAIWYFSFIISIAVSAIFVLTVSANEPTQRLNPWTAVYTEEFKSLNLLVLPMFTILVCTLLPQIEYKSNTWKQTLVSPQSILQVYLAKFLVVQLLLLLFLVLFLFSAFICTVISGLAQPSLHLFDHSADRAMLMKCVVRTYLSVFGLSVVQFILGLTMKNFIAPIATGFILWLLGNLLLFEMHSAIANFFPYSFSAMTVFPKYEDWLPMVELNSIVLGIFFLAGGYFIFRRVQYRQEKC